MKKLLYILSWIPFILLKLVLAILGLVAVPLALQFKTWPKLFWVWSNDEEGCPDWWLRSAWLRGGFISKFPKFWWYAVRNPVNNFRYIFKDIKNPKTETDWDFGIPMESKELLLSGKDSAYRWTFSGWKAGYRKIWITKDEKYSEIWFGWKLGSSVPGLGFTTQVRLNRKIGT